MPPSKILDTHIHLWPSTSTTSSAHGWMTTGHFLAKRHGINDYLAVAQPNPDGFVYVETDRYLSSPPQFNLKDQGEIDRVLKAWAHEPLEEIKFLKRIVEGDVEEGDGIEPGQGEKMKGCVIWAPFHLSPSIFQEWSRIAEEVAGPKLWDGKIVGFRYLLQGKGDGEVARLVSSEDWLENIVSLGRGRGGKGWAFDVGVDINRDGEEGLKAVGGMIKEVRRREEVSGSKTPVRFVLNHLCKPPLSIPTPSPAWIAALQNLKDDNNVFMKLSGAFNEFASTPETVQKIVEALTPYLGVVFDNFHGRVMFGSDWPVCNVGGPKGETGNWVFWRDVVEEVIRERELSEEEREGIWWTTGARAYGVDM